jgi:predicted membrane protein
MICNKCLKNIEDDAQFCNYCGNNITRVPSKPITEREFLSGGKKKATNKHNWNKWWANTDETILEQVENYYTLDFKETFRGKTILIQMFMLALTFVMIIAGVFDAYSYLDIGLLAILAFFTYRGGTVPIILMMIYYIISLLITITDGSGSLFTLIWAYFFFGMFYATYQIEVKKRKVKEANNLI